LFEQGRFFNSKSQYQFLAYPIKLSTSGKMCSTRKKKKKKDSRKIAENCLQKKIA